MSKAKKNNENKPETKPMASEETKDMTEQESVKAEPEKKEKVKIGPEKEKKKKVKVKKQKLNQPMSLSKRVGLGLLTAVIVCAGVYLAYYFLHYMAYDKYKQYLSSYEYETAGSFKPIEEAVSSVDGFVLAAENDNLKLYTDPKSAYVAVYDKRNGETIYSNPLNADDDPIANPTLKTYMKSQMIIKYFDMNAAEVTEPLTSFSSSVEKGKFEIEGISGGFRYVYHLYDKSNVLLFDIPLEYRLKEDKLEVSIPAKGIVEHTEYYVEFIEVLRYMACAGTEEEGYMVVPNGSGSLIYFNNGKNGVTVSNYSQYIYDIDPLVANYTTIEKTYSAKLPIYGLCRENSSVLVTVEDGATTSRITAGVAGKVNSYNYAYTTYILRNRDDLGMFGDSGTGDVYVMEPKLYDVNLCQTYTFLTEDYKGYAGMANYYRERLISEGKLTPMTESGDIPFYYDVIAGVKETAHFLGVQYLHTFSMTDFGEAKDMAQILAKEGITNQVMNLQGWFNGGYYHDAPHDIRVTPKLGGKKGLEELNSAIENMGGRLYVDVAIQKVTFADEHFNYKAESSRYYGAGYVAAFGQINPTTLRNTSGLDYMETKYDLLSPKFLPRYAGAFANKIEKYQVGGISLRDLGDTVASDKKRTEIINREEALDIVLAQFDRLDDTGKKLMTNSANAYSFAYSDDIINVPVQDNDFPIIDAGIPLYEMVIHGCIPYAGELLNFVDMQDVTGISLELIEAGAAPHFVFTKEDSSKMKNTGLNRYYATTFDIWEGDAVAIYNEVNAALKYVNGAQMINHEILTDDVRKVSYDNGVAILINYGDEEASVDGVQIPAKSYRLEGIN